MFERVNAEVGRRVREETEKKVKAIGAGVGMKGMKNHADHLL